MFRSTIRLGRLMGIPVGLDTSWFIIFVLITLSLAGYFRGLHPTWSPALHWSVGLATSLLFFVSVVLHELGHSVVAIHYRIPVLSITLFVFGGVARIAREPRRPAHEFWIAIAGPITSYLLAGIFYLSYALTLHFSEPVGALCQYLASINAILATFNLVPGFPLDGGRIARAIIWGVTANFVRATRIATRMGQVVAYGFIVYGVGIVLLQGNFFGGLWLAFIGWFLLTAARESYAQVAVREVLKGIQARDVMASDCLTISPSLRLTEFVEAYVLPSGRRCFLVVDGNRLLGLMTLHEVRAVERDRWPATTVAEAMTPAERLKWVGPDDEIMDILERMENEDINQMPVVEDAHLIGLLTREHVLRVLRTRLDLGI